MVVSGVKTPRSSLLVLCAHLRSFQTSSVHCFFSVCQYFFSVHTYKVILKEILYSSVFSGSYISNNFVNVFGLMYQQLHEKNNVHKLKVKKITRLVDPQGIGITSSWVLGTIL